jgi:hypothetical protein
MLIWMKFSIIAFLSKFPMFGESKNMKENQLLINLNGEFFMMKKVILFYSNLFKESKKNSFYFIGKVKKFKSKQKKRKEKKNMIFHLFLFGFIYFEINRKKLS